MYHIKLSNSLLEIFIVLDSPFYIYIYARNICMIVCIGLYLYMVIGLLNGKNDCRKLQNNLHSKYDGFTACSLITNDITVDRGPSKI